MHISPKQVHLFFELRLSAHNFEGTSQPNSCQIPCSQLYLILFVFFFLGKGSVFQIFQLFWINRYQMRKITCYKELHQYKAHFLRTSSCYIILVEVFPIQFIWTQLGQVKLGLDASTLVSLIWNRVHHTGTWPALSKFSQLQAWEITKLKFFVTNLIQCTKAKKHFWIRRAFFQNYKKRSRTDFRLLGVCRQVFLLSEECLMIQEILSLIKNNWKQLGTTTGCSQAITAAMLVSLAYVKYKNLQLCISNLRFCIYLAPPC